MANAGLRGRRAECETLDRLVATVQGGRSSVQILRGEAGIGKSALLEYVRERATGCRTARAAGVESEMELAFGGLHQLCAPFLDRLGRLPQPQREALATAFGLSEGTPPDRFLVGLAVLSLLADAAAKEPLICLVDDAQWLDTVSAQTVAFIARRLLAERIGLVIAVREGHLEPELAGLPQLGVGRLSDGDARALLDSVTPGRLDERVRDRIVAETQGNPLALLELPKGLTPAELAGGFGRPDARPLAGHIEQSFVRRVRALPAATQQVLLIAAAEPVGDVTLLARAAELLGIDASAGAPAEAAGLITIGTRVRFRHPLVRSAAYRVAAPQERQRVHRALADATDPASDPDRRAWHLANAASAPDETVAAELERSAGRAQARGGVAAAAAFLERAAELTPDPAGRGTRGLAAARAKYQAGAYDVARGLLDAAELSPLDEHQLAEAGLLRGQITFASTSAGAALPLLLAAAGRLEPLDPALARQTYRDALYAALTAGRLATGAQMAGGGGPAHGAQVAYGGHRAPGAQMAGGAQPAGDARVAGGGQAAYDTQAADGVRSAGNAETVHGARVAGGAQVADVARAALAAPPGPRPGRGDLLLAGTATAITEGYATGAPMVLRALDAFRTGEISREEGLGWLPLACRMAHDVWDFDGYAALSNRLVELARETGALSVLPSALLLLLSARVLAGDLAGAGALVAEAATIGEVTGSRFMAQYGALVLEPWKGDEAATREVIETITGDVALRGEGKVASATEWARAVLHNGHGRYEEAYEAAERGAEHPLELGLSTWSTIELVEAAARSGRPGRAAEAARRLDEMASASGTDWARGTSANARAQVSEGPAADALYREAIERLGRAGVRTALARARLLYGEWLRREGRRVDAREQLGLAYELLGAMGADAFAERARRELQATGETIRRRPAEAGPALTAQEAQIARLAAEGLTNPEIGAQLYISPNTVEWHLRKVFTKLGITSRKQLRTTLPAHPTAPRAPGGDAAAGEAAATA
ncbi:AAA family ATPase [Nonomuraea sp. FMUSA5-5]|uniref:AAA family ATPase n=1 Tax=Nonomuraea composti TaxID=2720023 RepID=A0ABX1B0V2_9ACTN|nr:LuxR family transcriptional regulator [Nonomuraea sp. FMUSA5-5]NJP88618.1 AAA family ATPase [Nonomuraea sp. FMUSA5-5]